jgi:hypothetical protein
MKRELAMDGRCGARRRLSAADVCPLRLLVVALLVLAGLTPLPASPRIVWSDGAPTEEEQKESQEESAKEKEFVSKPRRYRWREPIERHTPAHAAYLSDRSIQLPAIVIVTDGHRLSHELLAPLTT